MPRKKTKSSNRAPKKTSFLEKSQVGISLSSEAVKNLNEIVTETGLSKSKVVEGLVTGNLAIASQVAAKTISIESDENKDSSKKLTTKIQVLDGAVSDRDRESNISPTSPDETSDEAKNLAELKAKIKEHKADYQSLKQHAKEQEARVKELSKQLENQQAQAKEQDDNSQSDAVEKLEREIEQLKQQLSQQQTDNAAKEEIIEADVVKITEKDEALSQLQQQLDTANGDRDNAQQQLT